MDSARSIWEGPQAPDFSPEGVAAAKARKEAHDIVMAEYRRLKSQPNYHTLAERQRTLRLLDRLAKRIKG